MKTKLNGIAALLIVISLIGFAAKAIASGGPYAYVANSLDSTVSVIDTSTNNVVATVPVGQSPARVAVNPNGLRVYVTNYFGHTVSVINTLTNHVVATITVGSGPNGIAVTPDGTRIYVANFGDSTVSVIDTSTNGVVATLPVDENPRAVAVTPDGTRVYVAADWGSTISYINTSTNVVVHGPWLTKMVGNTLYKASPEGVAVSPDGTTICVTDGFGSNPDYVSVINPSSNSVVAEVAVGRGPLGIVAIPEENSDIYSRLYVANGADNTVSVIYNLSMTSLNYIYVLNTVPVGTEPFGIAATPDGRMVYVANYGSNNVSVIKTSGNAVVATIPVGHGPDGIAIGPAPHTVTSTLTPNVGSISPSGTTSVAMGATQTFTITPNPGYRINDVTGCGGTWTRSGNTYTTGPITSDCNISVSFVLETYTVNPTSPGGGSISPSSVQYTHYGQTLSFTVTPQTGWYISTVTGCGGTLFGNTYTTGPITSDCTVSATFSRIPHTVSTIAGPHGSITPASQVVGEGGIAYLRITPDWGYHVSSVTGCGGTLFPESTVNGQVVTYIYVTGPLTSDCTVSATFAVNTYTVDTLSCPNGSISPISRIVSYGQTTSFTVTPNPGYQIKSVTGCSGILSGNTYNTGAIASDCTVVASFTNGTAIPPGTYAYVSVYQGKAVLVIDTSTNTVVDTVPVGSGPAGVAVNPAGTRVYVTDYSNTVSVIDASTNTVVATVPVGQSPAGVAVNPAGTRVYVANDIDGTISVIDTSTNTVVATVTLAAGSYPFDIAVTPDGTRVYVTDIGTNTVSVIDTSTNTVVATVPVGTAGSVPFVYFIAVTPDGTKAFVTNFNMLGSSTVSVIETSTNTVVATVPVGQESLGVAVNPAGTRVYVTNSADNTVSVIDTSTNTVVATVPVGQGPVGVAVNRSGTTVYVTNGSASTVSVIDTSTNSVVATAPVGQGPGRIAIGPASTYTVTSSAGGNGSISCNPTTVQLNGSSLCNITPASGYRVADVTVGPTGGTMGSVGALSSYTISNITADMTIAATFDNTYSVVTNPGPNGSISCNPTTVQHNGSSLCTISPSSGYRIADVTVGPTGGTLSSVGAVGSYTIYNITYDMTIVATFVPNTSFIITATAGPNGSITPSGAWTVPYGGNGVFTITPDPGYRLNEESIDGYKQQYPRNPYPFYNVTADHTISATFTPDVYTITASVANTDNSVPVHGSMTPSGTFTVNKGSSITFTITPDTGYQVSSIIDNGTNNDATTSYLLSNIAADHTVTVYLKPTTYAVTATAGAGGKISPPGVTTVRAGGSQAYTITPNTGYSIADVTVGPTGGTMGSVGAVGSYTVSSITANMTIAATFKPNPTYTITASAGPNGSISPNGAVSVLGGVNQKFTITPNPGYRMDALSIDGVVQQYPSNPYTFVNVQGDHTISVTFVLDVYTISLTAASGGSVEVTGTAITPTLPVTVNGGESSTITVNPGANLSFTITGSVRSVVDNGSYKYGITTYTLTNIRKDHTINVYFK